ncbi:MAG: dipeptide epimerase [Gammaproteobacteria bacterium]|nr:dipeptide epimerase [Gammaproteobacteria bacterium]MDH5240917.1 dipeptide epimerase [Gammaproteobacteria bacterium]MDH5261920.1 dipeptide epimerase [Gammaproteobacteria bacterium]MDH5583545.1 dipeptide epimerase [Gammaproteobacteria bacterium]
MKITGFELGKLRIPLKMPFKTALRTVDYMEDVVIVLQTDTGHKGFGSAPATAVITGETHGSIIEAIRTIILPAIKNEDIQNLNHVVDLIQGSLYKNFSAKAAVEIAVYDLFAQSLGAPLYKILGGGEPVLSTDLTISVDYIDKMVQDAIDAADRGFEALKIKVGKDMRVDIERVKAIYAAVSDRALIRLDANQGWTPKQTVTALRELESSGVEIEFIEQPVRGNDVEGMKYVTERVTTSVMADESSFGPREVIDLIQMRGADIINIKLMKTGGISNAIKIADIAALYDVDCMMGCMLETAIGVSAAAHVAVAKSNSITRVDLDAPSLATVNPVVGGVLFNGSEIRISDAPGLGIETISELSMLKFDRAAAS